MNVSSARDIPGTPGETFGKLETLLMIDGDPLACELVGGALADLAVRVLPAKTAVQGLEIFRRTLPSLVLLDFHLPGQSGLETLEKILQIDPTVDVILVTGEHSTDIEVEAIRHGARECISKPFALEFLRERIVRFLETRSRKVRVRSVESDPVHEAKWRYMVGVAPAMVDLFTKIERVAPHYRTALVVGETGTGKELVAQAIHASSPVAQGPYVACNCAAFVEGLFESELFGYVKGAFTGATQDRAGLIASAHGGTLFLDEVGELTLGAQAKLLRVLQTREVRPVGSLRSMPVDVRVVAATNRNLEAMIREKTFREDLFYRLAMLDLKVPPLRERQEDIPLLTRHFLSQFTLEYSKPDLGISRRAMIALSHYRWPGNVRELENTLGAAALMAESNLIDWVHLPPQVRRDGDNESVAVLAAETRSLLSLAEATQKHIRFVLKQCGGNRSQAAHALGICRATLYRLLRESGDTITDAEI